jgi:hypothetical protein
MSGEAEGKGHGELHGGTVVRGTCVRVSNDPARVGLRGQEASAETRIEVIRNGEVIQAIDVFCSCGQHIRVHCLYGTCDANAVK